MEIVSATPKHIGELREWGKNHLLTLLLLVILIDLTRFRLGLTSRSRIRTLPLVVDSLRRGLYNPREFEPLYS